MIISLAVILLITFSGTLLTYLYEKEDSLLVRVGAGNVIGSVIFGTVAFLLACFFGFSAATILAALIIALLPLILLTNKNIRQNLRGNGYLAVAVAGFSGRASRKEYWMFWLFNMVLGIVAVILGNVLGTFKGVGYGPIYLIFVLVTLIPNLAVTIRRLHDTGKSGWYVLVALIPIIGNIWLLIEMATEGDVGENEYGANPKDKFEGSTFRKFLSFTYYILIFLVLCLFFERAMLETKDGIFTGGSQNLGDLPFHLGAIFSFTEGNNFPPENPSFAGAKFTYPFFVDFIAACLVKLGATVKDAMFLQNVTLGFSLVVLFEKFAVALTKNKLAGKLAPVIFLLSGGLGFVIFFRDYWQDGRGLFEFLQNLPMDYTIRPETLRWGNSLVVLFMTQRGFLLGMPIVLIVLSYLWKIFTTETQSHREEEIHKDKGGKEVEKTFSLFHFFTFPPFAIGLLAGALPLIHVHSLVVLFIVCAFLFFLSAFKTDNAKSLPLFVLTRIKWREWIIFGVAVSLIAVPELIWSLSGSATNLSKFIGWHFGWDAGKENFFLFWVKNLGAFIPLLLVSLFLTQRRKEAETQSEENKSPLAPRYSLLLFYIPFAFIFILSNTVKLAPWEWDNIKVLIYWFVASVPFVAWVLAHLWEKETFFKVIAVSCLIILTFSGGLDVWRVISRQINYQVFSKDAVKIAEEIKQKTPPNALFLNAPTYNSAVVLAGRRSLMRYSGHLSSYGIDYESRENEVKRIYEGSALADSFLSKNNIEYVLISPEEESYANQNNLILRDAFFAKYSKIAESGEYKVFRIK